MGCIQLPSGYLSKYFSSYMAKKNALSLLSILLLSFYDEFTHASGSNNKED